jgi:hypothetical protein
MSEEEKKAIELIKKEITEPEETPLEVYITDIKMLLHIIEKQQKEIEKMREELQMYVDTDLIIEKQQKENEELKERLSIRKEQQDSILTEKIKTLREEKIELIHNFEEKEKISKKEIKSLLKEIEELNEIKQQICNEELITQDYVQENFISKDKIREKIKELEDIKSAESIEGTLEEIKLLKELLEE